MKIMLNIMKLMLNSFNYELLRTTDSSLAAGLGWSEFSTTAIWRSYSDVQRSTTDRRVSNVAAILKYFDTHVPKGKGKAFQI